LLYARRVEQTGFRIIPRNYFVLGIIITWSTGHNTCSY